MNFHIITRKELLDVKESNWRVQPVIRLVSRHSISVLVVLHSVSVV